MATAPGVGGGGAGIATADPEEGMLTWAGLAKLLSDASVQLLGEFVVPGHYPIVGELTLDRVISAAGGIAPRADVGAVEITRSVLDPGRNELEVERQLHDLRRSEEHTSELQSLMRSSYAVFCLKKKKK